MARSDLTSESHSDCTVKSGLAGPGLKEGHQLPSSCTESGEGEGALQCGGGRKCCMLEEVEVFCNTLQKLVIS